MSQESCLGCIPAHASQPVPGEGFQRDVAPELDLESQRRTSKLSRCLRLQMQGTSKRPAPKAFIQCYLVTQGNPETQYLGLIATGLCWACGRMDFLRH